MRIPALWMIASLAVVSPAGASELTMPVPDFLAPIETPFHPQPPGGGLGPSPEAHFEPLRIPGAKTVAGAVVGGSFGFTLGLGIALFEAMDKFPAPGSPAEGRRAKAMINGLTVGGAITGAILGLTRERWTRDDP